MSKNKNKLRRTLALTASVAIMGTSIPFNVLANGDLEKSVSKEIVADNNMTNVKEDAPKEEEGFETSENLVNDAVGVANGEWLELSNEPGKTHKVRFTGFEMVDVEKGIVRVNIEGETNVTGYYRLHVAAPFNYDKNANDIVKESIDFSKSREENFENINKALKESKSRKLVDIFGETHLTTKSRIIDKNTSLEVGNIKDGRVQITKLPENLKTLKYKVSTELEVPNIKDTIISGPDKLKVYLKVNKRPSHDLDYETPNRSDVVGEFLADVPGSTRDYSYKEYIYSHRSINEGKKNPNEIGGVGIKNELADQILNPKTISGKERFFVLNKRNYFLKIGRGVYIPRQIVTKDQKLHYSIEIINPNDFNFTTDKTGKDDIFIKEATLKQNKKLDVVKESSPDWLSLPYFTISSNENSNIVKLYRNQFYDGEVEKELSSSKRVFSNVKMNKGNVSFDYFNEGEDLREYLNIVDLGDLYFEENGLIDVWRYMRNSLTLSNLSLINEDGSYDIPMYRIKVTRGNEVLHEHTTRLKGKISIPSGKSFSELYRITHEDREEVVEIPIEEKRVADDTMLKGEEKVVQEGEVGSKKIVYDVQFVDGKEYSKVEKSSEITKPMKPRIIHYGTAEKSMADTFVPEVTEEEVIKGNKADITDNIDNLPDEATVKEKEAPDTSKPGKTTGTVEVTFPDGSTKEVEIPVKVVEKAGMITPVPTVEAEKEVVPWGKDIDLTDNIKDLPEGATVEDVTDPAIDTKKPGEYTGKVKVTFKDGSSRVVEVPVEVEKSMADTFVPEVTEEEVIKGNKADITDNIDNLPDGATVEEKEAPDTNKPGKTTGKVEVTFPDGSTKEVEIPVNVQDLCEDTEPLKKKIEELEKELQDEKDKNKDLEDKIKNQEDKNKDLDDKIKDLEDQKKDLEDKLDQEKAKTEQDQDKIKDLEDKIADLEKQIEDLKKEKGELEKELEDLKGKLGDKDKEIADKDKEIEELKKLLEEAKKKSEEKPVVEDKKPSNKEERPNTTNNNNNNNNNINIDLGRNNFEREHHRRHRNRLPFEIVYERETPRYTNPAYTGHANYQENRLEYIFTIGSTVYQRIMGSNTENRSMDVAPYIKNDRTMLPLRYVAEAIGAEVRWDKATRTAYFTKDGVTAKIQIDGNKIEMSDGRIFEMDSKPDNIKGRIFVSLTNVSKVFNLTNGNTEDGINQQIEWNRHNKQVSISLNR